MPKLANGAVTAADIEQYLKSYSDFAFELSVLSTLTRIGLHCRHSGTYEDPVTQKTREFDFRAESKPAPKDGQAIVRLAIECKNLRPNYPLVVHRVARAAKEAFNDVVWSSKDSSKDPLNVIYTLKRSYGKRIRLRGDQSLYPPGQPVGKSSDQVGKRPDGELVTGDQDVFDRISQAIHSAYELLRISHYASLHDDPNAFAVVIPLLVVPPDRLWTVDYDAEGTSLSGPTRTKHVSYFIDRDWSLGDDATEYTTWYSLSHIEICEADYLETRIAEIVFDPRLKISAIFEAHHQEALQRRKGSS